MEKLIRDKIIEFAASKGETLTYRVVYDYKELIGFLLGKFDEELGEYNTAIKSDKKEEEAGDVLEVIDTLIKKNPNLVIYSTIRSEFIQKCIKDTLDIESIIIK
ncbi:hypothetical protein H7169_03050 [Candidatus Gracilibacteria bacterium]|nr:hypothetical protein [Candidatus Gracilibacteria bacterium]